MGQSMILMRNIGRWLALMLTALLLLASAAWGVLALLYFDHASQGLRLTLAVGFGIASATLLAGFATRRRRWRAFTAYVVLLMAVVASWLTVAPSNDRVWRPEVAVLPYATIQGDRITVHNIRNFDYRTETDFTRAYYDRTFDLRNLDSVDLVASYWMGPHIAHTFLSFGFNGQGHLAISIEARKEANEGYSSIKGFFRQYELYYVVADERDVIRVRTNYRRDPPEEVYLYRVQGSRDAGKRLLLDYMDAINALRSHPVFYNTLTTNCTTAIWMHGRVNPGRIPLSWKILASGHVPELLYESGKLDTRMAFAELMQASHINARAQAADQAEDFSRRIRAVAPAIARR